MYIRQLRIDQFGACADFEIGSLAPGLTVVYGPRGAGKTTLAAFLQGALFGFDTPLAARFLGNRSNGGKTADDHAAGDHTAGDHAAFRFARDLHPRSTETKSLRGRPLGGSLSLTLSPAADRSRDTRWLERHRDGEVDRLRLSRWSDEHDPRSSDGFRHEGKSIPLDPAAIDALYAGFPPRFLADLFVLDFERTTRLGALLEQAERYGTPLVDNVANPSRVIELEGELAKCRDQRAATADPGATPEVLSERRSHLMEEIAELEGRARRQQTDRARWRRQQATLVAALERHLASLTREIESLEATLATLVERRRHMATAIRPTKSLETSDPAVRDELQKLDEQLDRWRRTLGELIVAKGHAAELADASDRMIANNAGVNAGDHSSSRPKSLFDDSGLSHSAGVKFDAWGLLRRSTGALFGLADADLSGLPAGDPLRRLAELEASAFAISELLSKTQTLLREHAPPLVAAEMSEALERQHQMLRGQTRQLAEALAGWRHWITKRAAADEQQQLLRSEIEFRRAIAALEERRQKLLGRSVDPANTPIPSRTDTLDECQRLMDQRDAILRRRQETARQLSEAQRLATDGESPIVGRYAIADDGRHEQQTSHQTSHQTSQRDELDWNSLRLVDLDPQAVNSVDLEPAEIERQLRELRSQAGRLLTNPTGTSGNSVDAFHGESAISQIDAKRSHLMRLERDLAAAERRRELARRCEELERQLDEERARRSPHPVLLEAGEFLSELTDGRLPRIARDVRGFLRVATAEGEWLEWERLTDAAQDQVALATQVALAREFRRRGVQLPLIVNEPFARYSDRELAPAIRGLQRLSEQVQILCFTGDERAARAARQAGVALGWLRVDADGRPAVFDSARIDDRDALPSSRASWGVRRPHAWDSEEFPGELADRRRFAEQARASSENPDNTEFPADSSAGETPPHYLLNRAELAAHAPSITGLLAQRLEDRGVRTVGDLLAVNADTLAALLGDIPAKAIRGWQTQAELACRVPGLRATDCRVLAALQIGSVEKLATLKPAELWKRVSQATDSGDWDRVAPGVSPPDPATISNWIHAARRARSLAAA
ncbi:MAG: DUF4332 domain-containing protein [Planctomycetota bacterium]